MIWGPFLLALALGLVVSAGLYFAYLWPQVEPDEDAADQPGGGNEVAVAPGAAAEPRAPSEPPAQASESTSGEAGPA